MIGLHHHITIVVLFVVRHRCCSWTTDTPSIVFHPICTLWWYHAEKFRRFVGIRLKSAQNETRNRQIRAEWHSESTQSKYSGLSMLKIVLLLVGLIVRSEQFPPTKHQFEYDSYRKIPSKSDDWGLQRPVLKEMPFWNLKNAHRG